jgi:Arc/MetJ-type ribon-helix-helix transcriptional regulator
MVLVTWPTEEQNMSTIPADIQERVNALLGTGRYASEEEILRAAVTALEVQDADLAAIQAGVKDMERGRYRPFAEFDAEFRRRNQIGTDV